MNSAGTDEPALGCRQRTSASKPTSRPSVRRHDRLVVDAELAALDGAPQVVLEVEQRQPARAWPRRTPRSAPARATWPGTWRCRRRAAGPRPSRSPWPTNAMPMLAGDDLVAVEVEGLAPARPGCARRRGSPSSALGDVVEQDRELVAARGAPIRRPGGGSSAKRFASTAQQLVADQVARGCR